MPDNPTDKKLTFVEWMAMEAQSSEIDAKRTIEGYGNFLAYGTHTMNCPKKVGCPLCTLEQWLSEYREYFKQK